MKVSINILPDKQKETMKEERKMGSVMKWVFSVIAVLLIVNAVLFLMQTVLGIELPAVQRSGESSASNNAGKEVQLEKIFKDTNTRVTNISKISQNIPDWAKVLMRLSDLVPSGIKIYQLSADGTVIKISGFSKTREDFLEFQDRLKEEGFEFPVDIANLVASYDFTFDMNVNIPRDYLIRK